MGAGELLQLLNTLTFGLLAVVTGAQWNRRRDAPSFWAFATFFILAWVTLVGWFAEDAPGLLGEVLARVDLLMLASFPFALYRFVASFRQPRLGEQGFVGGMLVLIAVITLIVPSIPGENDPQPDYWGAYVMLFVAHWAITLVLLAARLWSVSRTEASAAGKRIRMVGAGAGMMTVAMLIAGFASGMEGRQAQTLDVAAQVAGLVAALAFYAGYAPPYPLRIIWRVKEELELRAAVANMVRASSMDELVRPLLPAVCGIASGRAAALFDPDGGQLGAYRVEPDDLEAIVELGAERAEDPHRAGVLVRQSSGSPSKTFIAVDFPSGRLVVWTTPFTTFFGTEEIALLRSLGAVTDLGVDHVVLVEREREATRRMREVNELKNEFVAMVAHDLRSPMTVISGFVDTIINRWEDIADDEKLEYLRMVSRNTKSLAELVEDVLQVARIESGEFTYEMAAFDLRRTVERTVRELQAANGERDIVVTAPARLPEAWGDEERNWQVLTNLLSNAVKFSPQDARVEVVLSAAERELRVAVRDQGAGISPDDQQRLFQKFSRLDATRSVKGTGLGLYICKALVEAQGGRIWVESPGPNAGSTFVYTIPVAPDGKVGGPLQ